jgi:hypothetical protein
VRGAASATQAAPHLLSVSSQQSQETLAQVRVADKTNELRPVSLKTGFGRVEVA